MSKPFIGIGTGRCGTQSLARILSEVGGCSNVTHESEKYRSRVWGEIDQDKVQKFKGDADRSDSLFGDVAFYHLPVVDQFIDAVPDLKLVAMIRDQYEVAESFLARTKGAERLGPSKRGWNKLFPHIEAQTPLEAWCRYWEHYYLLVQHLSLDVLWLNTHQLNDNDSLDCLYSFLEIPASDRVYPSNRKFNSRRKR